MTDEQIAQMLHDADEVERVANANEIESFAVEASEDDEEEEEKGTEDEHTQSPPPPPSPRSPPSSPPSPLWTPKRPDLTHTVWGLLPG